MRTRPCGASRKVDFANGCSERLIEIGDDVVNSSMPMLKRIVRA
jgi:hypothetical protein